MTRLTPNRDGWCDASDANWYFSTYFYVELFFLEFLRRHHWLSNLGYIRLEFLLVERIILVKFFSGALRPTFT